MRKLTTLLVICLIMVVAVGGIGCSGKVTPSPTPEPTIPLDFTTYTDDAGIFSISYPADWWAPLQPDLQLFDNYMNAPLHAIPADRAFTIFTAYHPTNYGGLPRMGIIVIANQSGLQTIDSIVDAVIQKFKSNATNWHELSRSKITVRGEEAVVLEYEATSLNVGNTTNIGKVLALSMWLLKGENICGIICGTTSENYSYYEQTFEDIFLSFRVYK